MGLNEYQDFVKAIRLPTADYTYVALGLSGEVGELLGAIAKWRRDGEPMGVEDYVRKELGDILWFLAALSSDYGIQFGEVLATNVAKLESRRDRGTLQGSGDNR